MHTHTRSHTWSLHRLESEFRVNTHKARAIQWRLKGVMFGLCVCGWHSAPDEHTSANLSNIKDTIKSMLRLHIPWPLAVGTDHHTLKPSSSKSRQELKLAERGATVHGVRVCVCVCSWGYFLHSTICPWWSGLYNYFTYSHTSSLLLSTSLRSPITLFLIIIPHHTSSSSSTPFLFFLSSLHSSVRPSLFSVSAYLSSSPVLPSWPCLCS